MTSRLPVRPITTGFFVGLVLGAWSFRPLVRRVCVGILPEIMALSPDARLLAMISFSGAMGLAFASIPAAGWLAAGKGRGKGGVCFLHSVRAGLVGTLCFGLAGWYYRHGLNQGWIQAREVFALVNYPRFSLVLNPLTHMAMAAAAGILAYGVGRRFVAQPR